MLDKCYFSSYLASSLLECEYEALIFSFFFLKQDASKGHST